MMFGQLTDSCMRWQDGDKDTFSSTTLNICGGRVADSACQDAPLGKRTWTLASDPQAGRKAGNPFLFIPEV